MVFRVRELVFHDVFLAAALKLGRTLGLQGGNLVIPALDFPVLPKGQRFALVFQFESQIVNVKGLFRQQTDLDSRIDLAFFKLLLKLLHLGFIGRHLLLKTFVALVGLLQFLNQGVRFTKLLGHALMVGLQLAIADVEVFFRSRENLVRLHVFQYALDNIVRKALRLQNLGNRHIVNRPFISLCFLHGRIM